MTAKVKIKVRIWSNFYQTLELIDGLVKDFENISNGKIERHLLSKISSVKIAYMISIVVTFYKIFSKSKQDKYSLEFIEKEWGGKIKDKIDKFKKDHDSIINKFLNNRKKIFAHLDKNFHKLTFSKGSKEELIKERSKLLGMSEDRARIIYAKIPEAASKDQERYTIEDMIKDLPEINDMIKELQDIKSEMDNV